MNKQELIKKYKRLEGVWNASGAETARQIFLQDLEQLDEQKPVKVQQFVADWYEKNKDDFEGNLLRCVHNILSIFDGAKLNEFERWFLIASTKSFQTLVNMHQFGYEVEKEKRYWVKLKGAGQCLEKTGSVIHFSTLFKFAFTKKELEEASFGWVFDCEGVEIEEVDD